MCSNDLSHRCNCKVYFWNGQYFFLDLSELILPMPKQPYSRGGMIFIMFCLFLSSGCDRTGYQLKKVGTFLSRHHAGIQVYVYKGFCFKAMKSFVFMIKWTVDSLIGMPWYTCINIWKCMVKIHIMIQKDMYGNTYCHKLYFFYIIAWYIVLITEKYLTLHHDTCYNGSCILWWKSWNTFVSWVTCIMAALFIMQ